MQIEPFTAWDPLEQTSKIDEGIYITAQRRQISNILRSYTGYYDLFSELLQNSLDAVEKRRADQAGDAAADIWIHIDLIAQEVTVTDNGCGMDFSQLRLFLKPDFSFKSGKLMRGSKGVGATYLGYGFNSLTVCTRHDGKTYAGRIEGGRLWVEDQTGTIPRPKIVPCDPNGGPFAEVEQGTSISVRLKGESIRPKNLSWYQASTAKQWLALLKIMTPVGGLHIDGSEAPPIQIHVSVLSQDGEHTSADLHGPEYLYPHKLVNRSGNLGEFIDLQAKKVASGGDVSKVPPKFQRLSGLWGQWTSSEILQETKSNCPIQVRLDASERELAKSAGLSIYVYLAFSTDLWDQLNDNDLGLRRGARVLRGGLQLATRHMPQGSPLTIPMTNNIGFQNLAHVVIHFDNAEPDLGRKGFQPEYVQLAEKVAVSAVTAFRKRYNLLRKPGAAKIFNDELKIEQWIRDQEDHEKKHSLIITGAGLFMPTEELPIRSEPRVEQDVVALFNQMLSSGLIRGLQLIASSQYNQYDGLYRVEMNPPFEKFIWSSHNPLGIDADFFSQQEGYRTTVKVLEYKYSLDGLIEEVQTGVKDVNDVGLVVAWTMGSKWREMFDITCLLDNDLTHHRQIHGTTHSFTHSVSGSHAFEAIILHDLTRYLSDPATEVLRQRSLMDAD